MIRLLMYYREEHHPPRKMKWRERRFYSIQLEILQNMINDVFKHMILFLMSGATVMVVIANLLLLKLNFLQDCLISLIF